MLFGEVEAAVRGLAKAGTFSAHRGPRGVEAWGPGVVNPYNGAAGRVEEVLSLVIPAAPSLDRDVQKGILRYEHRLISGAPETCTPSGRARAPPGL